MGGCRVGLTALSTASSGHARASPSVSGQPPEAEAGPDRPRVWRLEVILPQGGWSGAKSAPSELRGGAQEAYRALRGRVYSTCICALGACTREFPR
eukprot:scaffold1542_cov402-Prasinococcus_capsulatus_cf.AAC.8